MAVKSWKRKTGEGENKNIWLVTFIWCYSVKFHMSYEFTLLFIFSKKLNKQKARWSFLTSQRFYKIMVVSFNICYKIVFVQTTTYRFVTSRSFLKRRLNWKILITKTSSRRLEFFWETGFPWLCLSLPNTEIWRAFWWTSERNQRFVLTDKIDRGKPYLTLQDQ